MGAVVTTVAPEPTSVIICAYTELRWDDLLLAVQSIQQQTVPPAEIIVVVDHNEALFRRASETLDGVCVIENVEPKGLSGARNTGIAQASGSIVAFMDEDATAEPDWLEQLLGSYQHANVLGAGGAIDPAWISKRPGWFPEEFDWVVGCTYRGMPTSMVGVRNLIGCNMSFRRTLFAKVGGFRNGIGRVGTLPVGCEETELCIRASQAEPNGLLIYQPAARVRHRVPRIRTTWKYYRQRCYSEGLSKALISRFVGANDALSSERTYMLQILPKGVVAGFRTAIRGDVAGFLRAGAIIGGLGFTVLGYVSGRISSVRRPVTTSPAPSTV